MEYRVMVVESIDDRLSRARAAMMARSPELQGLIIEHCFAVEPTEEDLQEKVGFDEPHKLAEYAAWVSRGAPLSYEDLLETMEAKVSSFQPDLIMLHTGIVFHRYPQVFLDALSAIKNKYPHIRVGFEHRSSDAYLASNPVFDHDEVTYEVAGRIFGRTSPR